jgi:hypothetical protein
MRGRILALTLALLAAGEARAHRLDAACRILPRRMVRVESWFDNGDLPKTGQVEVFSDSGELLIKGRLSSQGLFLFDAPERGGLRVTIDAGEGHGKELAIRSEELMVAAPAESPAPAPAGPAVPSNDPPPVKHEESFPLKDVIAGIGLLVAVAAFAMSLRNARSIRDLKRPRS